MVSADIRSDSFVCRRSSATCCRDETTSCMNAATPMPVSDQPGQPLECAVRPGSLSTNAQVSAGAADARYHQQQAREHGEREPRAGAAQSPEQGPPSQAGPLAAGLEAGSPSRTS